MKYFRSPEKYTPLAKLLARQARPGTTEDGSGNKAENYPSISASIKTKDVPIKSSKASLFEFNFVLFKILQIKSISSRHFEGVHLRNEWA